jgi:hypothetical protein
MMYECFAQLVRLAATNLAELEVAKRNQASAVSDDIPSPLNNVITIDDGADHERTSGLTAPPTLLKFASILNVNHAAAGNEICDHRCPILRPPGRYLVSSRAVFFCG